MKRPWNVVVLFRFFLPFLLGLLIAFWLIEPKYLFGIGTVILLAGFVVFAYYRIFSYKQFRQRWLGGLGLFCIFCGLGVLNVWLNRLDLNYNFFGKYVNSGQGIYVRLTEPIQVKNKSILAIVTVAGLIYGNELKQTSGNLVIYFEKDSNTSYPFYGDLLLINGQIDSIASPKNEGEFDFRRFMAIQNIYHSTYLKQGDWKVVEHDKGNLFWKSIYQARVFLKTEIENSIPNPDEQGIVEALVFGDETGIPGEIMSNYAGTGTLHVLSVSGLHVGIILLVLNAFLSFLLHFRHGRWLRMLLILIIIWSYAFFTGFSPPIARSVIMFSLVYMGTFSGRNTNIYNSICTAAFILLIMDPFVVMQAGFQLSFIALTGIVWLQPQIFSLWKPKNKVMHWFWELSAASIAAQIFTLPVSIFYFNQISLYFLPANLIVIPFSFIVMGGGIIFVLMILLHLISLKLFMALFLHYSISLLNTIVKDINDLPGANWQGLYLDFVSLLLFYICIILLVLCFAYRQRRLIIPSLGIIVIFLVYRNINIGLQMRNNEVRIFGLSKGHTIFMVKRGPDLLVLSDSGFVTDKTLLKYHINGFRIQNYISSSHVKQIRMDSKHPYIEKSIIFRPPWLLCFHYSWLLIDHETDLAPFLSSTLNGTEIDGLILCNSPEISLFDLYQKYRFKYVIASIGNDLKKTRQWETECLENNIPFTNLQTNKAFRVSL